MRNCVLTVLGQKGSGKTSFTRWLVQQTPRVVVVDRFLEYGGAVTGSFNDAVDYLAARWRSPFKLVCRFVDDIHHREMFRFLAVTMRRAPTTPIALVVEEADFFATPHYMEPTLEALFRYGRHYRLNLLTVARGDTDLNRNITGNSDVLVVFRSRRFSRDMRERFTAEDLQRLAHLESLTPGAVPEKGKHYLTFPAEEDPVALWRSCQHLGPGDAPPAPPSEPPAAPGVAEPEEPLVD